MAAFSVRTDQPKIHVARKRLGWSLRSRTNKTSRIRKAVTSKKATADRPWFSSTERRLPSGTRNIPANPGRDEAPITRKTPGCGTLVKLACCFLNEQRYSRRRVTSRIMGAGVVPSANRNHRKYSGCRRRRSHSRSRFHHAGIERLPLYSGKQWPSGAGPGKTNHRKYSGCRRRRSHSRSRFHHAGIERL